MKQTIITPQFEALFKDYPIYSQEGNKDPLVITKLFAISGSAAWYLTEYDPETKKAFGYVEGLAPGDDEWGYIYIPELEETCLPGTTVPFIERDLCFQSRPFSQRKGP